jgi:hypothetical protein
MPDPPPDYQTIGAFHRHPSSHPASRSHQLAQPSRLRRTWRWLHSTG